MFLENRDNVVKSLFSHYLSHHLAHYACSILAHWVELCLVLRSQHFDVHVLAFVFICDMGIYKDSFILHFSMLLVLMKLQMWKRTKKIKEIIT